MHILMCNLDTNSNIAQLLRLIKQWARCRSGLYTRTTFVVIFNADFGTQMQSHDFYTDHVRTYISSDNDDIIKKKSNFE